MATKRGIDDDLSEECQSPIKKRLKIDGPKDRENEKGTNEPKSDTCKLGTVVHEKGSSGNKDTAEIPVETFQSGKTKRGRYKYIDTEDKLSSAINDIQKAIKDGQIIAVDCEGVDLSRFGSVTMVNVALRDLVYLIDVQKIGKTAYDRGLRSILEDDSVEKLMFDCREDSDALFHLNKVKLNGVLDLQLIEVMRRGLDRRGYTKIRSLKHCLELYVNDDTLLNIKLQGRAHMSAFNNIWKERPLSADMLRYASVDVLSLFELYGVIGTGVDRKRWKSKSSLYCDNKRSRNRTYRDGSGILPSGIL